MLSFVRIVSWGCEECPCRDGMRGLEWGNWGLCGSIFRVLSRESWVGSRSDNQKYGCLGAPLQGLGVFVWQSPGRCPGLVWGGPSARKVGLGNLVGDSGCVPWSAMGGTFGLEGRAWESDWGLGGGTPGLLWGGSSVVRLGFGEIAGRCFGVLRGASALRLWLGDLIGFHWGGGPGCCGTFWPWIFGRRGLLPDGLPIGLLVGGEVLC